jgi:hypothetical protein
MRVGDTVLATDTRTGKDQPETVTAVLVHHDTNLYNLTVKTSHGTEIIHTTSNHLFWDPYLHQWVPASKLKKGEHLKTPDGTLAVADGGTTPRVHDGWMWDLTVPGNNDHDFYVLAVASHVVGNIGPEATAILVHNTTPCGPTYENPGHHDPTGGPNPYNPNKAVLPTDAESQFENSVQVGSTRWTKIGKGKNAIYYRYFDTGNDVWHWSGSTGGVTRSGKPVFRFQIILDGRLIGDDEPCILGSAMGKLRDVGEFERLDFDPAHDSPAVVVSMLDSSEELHDATAFSIAESLDGWLIHGLIFGEEFVIIAQEYRDGQGEGEILRTVVRLGDYEAVVEAAYRYWLPLTSHGLPL